MEIFHIFSGSGVWAWLSLVFLRVSRGAIKTKAKKMVISEAQLGKDLLQAHMVVGSIKLLAGCQIEGP